MTKSDKQMIENELAKRFKKEIFYGRRSIKFYSSDPPKYNRNKIIPLSEVVAYCRKNLKPYEGFDYYNNKVKALNEKTWKDIHHIEIML